MYENKGEIKQRKQIVNAFNRQALFYDDKIVITYTFTDNPEHLKKTKESSLENGKKVTDETDETKQNADVKNANKESVEEKKEEKSND